MNVFMVISKIRKVWEATPLEKRGILKISLKKTFFLQFKEANGGRWTNYDEGDATDEESFMGDLPSITITKYVCQIFTVTNETFCFTYFYGYNGTKVIKNTSTIVKPY